MASLQDSLAAARLRLATDTALRTQVRGKAWREVFGPQPTQPVDDTMDAGALHFELRQHYFHLLARDADAQARAVDLAYRFVVQRPARAQEIAYWHQHGPLPFIVLVGCVENWARRNQPGLMATSGTPTVSPNSTWLVSVRVSPSLAQEVWSMMTREADAEARGEPPRVLAPGAGQVATDGNMFLFLASDERVEQTGRRTTGLRH